MRRCIKYTEWIKERILLDCLASVPEGIFGGEYTVFGILKVGDIGGWPGLIHLQHNSINYKIMKICINGLYN